MVDRYKDRNGGYTKLIKVDNRTGYNAPMVLTTFIIYKEWREKSPFRFLF
ncbi:L17 family ribosomal protein [Spiroplasma endosymbiont of Nebria brevicollis]